MPAICCSGSGSPSSFGICVSSDVLISDSAVIAASCSVCPLKAASTTSSFTGCSTLPDTFSSADCSGKDSLSASGGITTVSWNIGSSGTSTVGMTFVCAISVSSAVTSLFWEESGTYSFVGVCADDSVIRSNTSFVLFGNSWYTATAFSFNCSFCSAS